AHNASAMPAERSMPPAIMISNMPIEAMATKAFCTEIVCRFCLLQNVASLPFNTKSTIEKKAMTQTTAARARARASSGESQRWVEEIDEGEACDGGLLMEGVSREAPTGARVVKR